jgi:hypothetical protein
VWTEILLRCRKQEKHIVGGDGGSCVEERGTTGNHSSKMDTSKWKAYIMTVYEAYDELTSTRREEFIKLRAAIKVLMKLSCEVDAEWDTYIENEVLHLIQEQTDLKQNEMTAERFQYLRDAMFFRVFISYEDIVNMLSPYLKQDPQYEEWITTQRKRLIAEQKEILAKVNL